MFKTKTYAFHYLEVASGLKIVVTSDLSVEDMQEQLWGIYNLFATMVVQNPNWEVNDSIDMLDFTAEVDHLLI